jgi:lipopolysaccharide export system ATP-binding protein
LFEIRRMTFDEVDKYLGEQILGRLAAEGWLKLNGDAGGGGVAVDGAIWGEIRANRTGFGELLEREIERRILAPVDEATAAPPVAGDSHIAARGLVKIYSKRRVVDEVDIDLRQGEIVGLLGPNGAGKTTTFYMIVGLVAPNNGEVTMDDLPLSRMPMYRRARLGIGYLSQEPSVFRKLTVEQNINAILETLPLSQEERNQRLEELLDELTIKHLPIAVDDIQRIVAGLKRRGLGVLITDHNVRETLSITDRAYIMFDGKIHIEGTSQELVNDSQARKLYLGEDFRL